MTDKTIQRNCDIKDMWNQIIEIGKTPIIITSRYTIQTLHLAKNEYKTKCNQFLTDILGNKEFKKADLTLKSKKCKRCYNRSEK